MHVHSYKMKLIVNSEILKMSDQEYEQAKAEVKLTKTTKHAKRHFWLTDVCTCHGLLPSHSA
jgi:hypothetical protein